MPSDERWHSLECRCGSRNTVRVGDSALQRQCQACGETYAWRVSDGRLIPFGLELAEAIDDERRPDLGHDKPFKLWPWEKCNCKHCYTFRKNIEAIDEERACAGDTRATSVG